MKKPLQKNTEMCYGKDTEQDRKGRMDMEQNQKRNYQKELEKLLQVNERSGKVPRLYLHSCCAPCSSYVLEYLSTYFEITVFYYNPNISFAAEYEKRVEEQKKLIDMFNAEMEAGERRGFLISVEEGQYEPERFYELARGLEQCPEGGDRCFRCFDLRLRETAVRAQAGEYDYFGTTLTISPLKNAQKLNEIGVHLAAEYGVEWLPSDFKKKNGYKRSVELSEQYGLYRQDYCGCVYSKAEREK